jgi:hypothetical protein
MKNTIKLALAAAAGLAAAASAHAQANYNGDLMVGFSSGSGNDLIYDIGSVSSLQNGETWSLGSLLSGDASTMNWGVIGNTLNGLGKHTDNTIFTTTSDPTVAPGIVTPTIYGNLNSVASTLFSALSPAGEGGYAQVAATTTPPTGVSWNMQTITGAGPVTYVNVYENPNILGAGSEALWAVDDYATQTSSQLGTFSLDGTGTLTYNAVPEPATLSMLGGFGLLALSFRRKLNTKA